MNQHRGHGGSVTALLAFGASTLDDSQQAVHTSRRLADDTRSLLFSYRSHRVRPIRGASDADGHDGLRRMLSAFPSTGQVKTRVGQSGGSACDACGSHIFVGDIEYDVVVEGHEMKLDATCYLILVDEAARLQSDA